MIHVAGVGMGIIVDRIVRMCVNMITVIHVNDVGMRDVPRGHIAQPTPKSILLPGAPRHTCRVSMWPRHIAMRNIAVGNVAVITV